MVMALFGAPVDDPDHADHAVATAVEMVRALEVLNARWLPEGRPALGIGIGVNSGEMIAGNIGSASIRSYTVIGDAVNLGARLESLNKEHGTTIIISAATVAQLKTPPPMRPLGSVIVKGKSVSVEIFEVLVGADAGGPVEAGGTGAAPRRADGPGREVYAADERFDEGLDDSVPDGAGRLRRAGDSGGGAVRQDRQGPVGGQEGQRRHLHGSREAAARRRGQRQHPQEVRRGPGSGGPQVRDAGRRRPGARQQEARLQLALHRARHRRRQRLRRARRLRPHHQGLPGADRQRVGAGRRARPRADARHRGPHDQGAVESRLRRHRGLGQRQGRRHHGRPRQPGDQHRAAGLRPRRGTGVRSRRPRPRRQGGLSAGRPPHLPAAPDRSQQELEREARPVRVAPGDAGAARQARRAGEEGDAPAR